MLYSLLRRALFLLDAEKAHDLSLQSLEKTKNNRLTRCLHKPTVSAHKEVMGLQFRNSVGLAAGLDKNGDYIEGLARLGFGFIEIGTVTPRPQVGNPRPRLFRVPEAQAIINRMGFNNKGIDYLVERVAEAKHDCILGINIGKNKTTSNADAVNDYVHCLEKAYPFADYITVNISSPNTPGLRELQNKDELHSLISHIKTKQMQLADTYKRHVPLALKVAPDMETAQIDHMCEILLQHNIEGLIVSNTTVDREPIATHQLAHELGGLSGKPLFDKANQALIAFSNNVKNDMAVIGVGGITHAQDAQQKIALGADLVQVYTGFIYRGPSLIHTCAKALA